MDSFLDLTLQLYEHTDLGARKCSTLLRLMHGVEQDVQGQVSYKFDCFDSKENQRELVAAMIEELDQGETWSLESNFLRDMRNEIPNWQYSDVVQEEEIHVAASDVYQFEDSRDRTRTHVDSNAEENNSNCSSDEDEDDDKTFDTADEKVRENVKNGDDRKNDGVKGEKKNHAFSSLEVNVKLCVASSESASQAASCGSHHQWWFACDAVHLATGDVETMEFQ